MARDRRWIIGLATALTLSLALNLLVAGVMISNRLDGRRPSFGGIGGGGGRMFEQLFRDLSPGVREQLSQSFQALKPARQDDYKAIRQARAEIARLIAAERLDRAALEAQFTIIEGRTAAMQQRLNRAFIDGVVALPLAERQRIAPPPPPPDDKP